MKINFLRQKTRLGIPPKKNPERIFKSRGIWSKFLNFFKKFNLASWLKKNKPLFVIFLIVLVISTVIVLIFYFDRKKPIHYMPEEEVNFGDLDWLEKVDNSGYSFFADADSQFEWKADIYVPENSFLFKVEDIAKVVFHIRNLEGTVRIPLSISFEGMHKHPIDKGFRIVSGRKELRLESEAHFASFLGLNFVSPYQDRTISINEEDFNIATIHLPKESKAIKYGDGLYPAGAYKVNDQIFFFHNFVTPAIVYYTFPYYLFVRIGFGLLIIIVLLLGVLIIRKYKFPIYRFQSKHFLYAMLICAVLMIVLSALIPNPRSIILNWDRRPIYYRTDGLIALDKEIPNYLWWVLGMTRSIDTMIIGDTKGCGPERYRHYFLAKYSVEKFIILEEFQDSTCARFVKNLAPQKTVIVPQNKVEEELTTLKNRKYPLDFLFVANTKIIVLLSNLIVFFACAFLIWKAFTIKKIWDPLLLIIYGYSLFFGLMFVYILTGLLAHMPITYHAVNNLGFIMTNYFIPGVIRGGNNLRTLFAVLGGGFVLFFARKVRARTTSRIYLALIIVSLSLFLIPPTDYPAKRFMLTATSAEAYIWDYKQNIFNSFHLFQSIRDNTLIEYLRYAFSKKAKGERELSMALSMRQELRYKEAIELYKLTIVKYKGLKEIVSEAHFQLAESYYEKISSALVREKTEFLGSKDYYATRAVEEYTEYLKTNPDGKWADRSMFYLAKCYQILREFNKAIEEYSNYIKKYPRGPFTADAKFYRAQCHFHRGEYDKAIGQYFQYIRTYSSRAVFVDRAMFNIAESYMRIGEIEKANEAYSKVVKNYPQSVFVPRSRFEIAQNYEGLGKRDESIRIYHQLLSEYPEDSPLMHLIYQRIRYTAKLSEDQRSFIIALLEGISAEGTKSYSQAINIYKSIKDRSFDPLYTYTIIYRLAETCHKMGDSIEEILEKRPYYKEVLDVESKEISGKEDYYKKAQEYYNKIIKECPYDIYLAFVRKNLAKIDIKLQGLSIPTQERLISKISVDTDQDDLSDVEEIRKYKTNPEKSDSDGDKIMDGKEISLDQNPLGKGNLDSDRDGLTDLEEKELKSNPYNQDTDEDGRKDKEEVDQGLNPRGPGKLIIKIEEVAKKFKVGPKIPAILERATFRDLFTHVRESRGMSIYFASIISLLIILFIRRSFRTIIILFIVLIMARGIIRIGEQDPFRAYFSLRSGFVSGIQLALALLAASLVLYLILHLARFQRLIRKIRKVIRSKNTIKIKFQKIFYLIKLELG